MQAQPQADGSDIPLEGARLDAFVRIFSAEPMRTTAYIRDRNDEGDGIPAVFEELSEEQHVKCLQAVDACKGDDEKARVWDTEPLVYSLVSVGDVDFPPTYSERKKIIHQFPRAVVQALAIAYKAFLVETLAAREYVEKAASPN